MTEAIIVALLSLAGTLAGSYFASSKNLAVLRSEVNSLKNEVEKHNKVVERTYKLERDTGILRERTDEQDRRLEALEHERVS